METALREYMAEVETARALPTKFFSANLLESPTGSVADLESMYVLSSFIRVPDESYFGSNPRRI